MNAKAKIVALLRTRKGEPETALAEKVSAWRARGVRVAGVLAEPGDMPGRTCSAGYLRDIATGTAKRIYLDIPPSTSMCDLDGAGVAAVGGGLIDQIRASEVVVLSKYGLLEAGGGGLLPAFRAAIAAGKPLLTTVSEVHLPAWRAFAPEAELLSDAAALAAWRPALGRSAEQP